jgi:hypothetical protein
MAEQTITAETEALDCDGYRKLLALVEYDETKSPRFHDYRGKLNWIVNRAKHYAEKTGLSPEAILDAWDAGRVYWYMNYYQDANQPLLDAANVRVFQTVADVVAAVGTQGFRCPYCKGVSKNPSACDSGLKVKLMNGKGLETCNWKVYGLFRDLGKGVHLFCVEKMQSQLIFMPIAWETNQTVGTVSDNAEVANDQS